MSIRDEIDFRDYWFVIKRSRRVILFWVLLFAGLATAYNFVAKPVYEATAQIVIEREPTRSPLTGVAQESSNPQSESMALDTAVGLITNKDIMGRIADAYKDALRPSFLVRFMNKCGDLYSKFLTLSGGPDPRISADDRERADRITHLFNIVSVAPVADARLVNIHVDHSDPFVARDIANALGQSFTAFQAEQREKENQTLAAYIDNQLSHVGEQIRESENAFYTYKDRAGIYSLEGKMKEGTDTLQNLNVSYVKAKADRLAVEARLNKLTEIVREKGMEPSVPLPIQSDTLEALRKQLLLAETDLVRAREVYKSSHPKLIDLESAVQSIKQNIKQELKNAIADLKAEHAILVSRERELRTAIGQHELEMHQLNKKASDYLGLEHELNTGQDMQKLLLTRLQEVGITGKIKTPSVRVVDPATTPIVPIRPMKLLNLILGVFLGLLVGTGAVFVMEYMQRKIRMPHEVTVLLQLPVLGIIPKRT